MAKSTNLFFLFRAITCSLRCTLTFLTSHLLLSLLSQSPPFMPDSLLFRLSRNFLLGLSGDSLLLLRFASSPFFSSFFSSSLLFLFYSSSFFLTPGIVFLGCSLSFCSASFMAPASFYILLGTLLAFLILATIAVAMRSMFTVVSLLTTATILQLSCPFFPFTQVTLCHAVMSLIPNGASEFGSCQRHATKSRALLGASIALTPAVWTMFAIVVRM